MKEKMIEGEWSEVIGNARPVFELLRKRDPIRDLLQKDGYTAETANYLLDSIQSSFKFSSKFLHRLDENRERIIPEIKASKEDAYLTYVTSAALINLIARKLKKTTV